MKFDFRGCRPNDLKNTRTDNWEEWKSIRNLVDNIIKLQHQPNDHWPKPNNFVKEKKLISPLIYSHLLINIDLSSIRIWSTNLFSRIKTYLNCRYPVLTKSIMFFSVNLHVKKLINSISYNTMVGLCKFITVGIAKASRLTAYGIGTSAPQIRSGGASK